MESGIYIENTTPEETNLFSNSEKVRLISCPILIMHGEDDVLISPNEAKRNYHNVGSKIKTLNIIKGVGHNDMMMASDNAYFKSLDKFFNSQFFNS